MKALPKSLLDYLVKHPDKFEEGHTEQDDFAGTGKWSHWVYLKPGWFNPATETHMIHEPTIPEVRRQFRGLRPCKCEDCTKVRVAS